MILQYFTFPGAADKIDRIMTGFAEEYFKQHPSPFENVTSVYTFAFSLIMLNHTKSSLASFVKLSKGSNGGKDFSPEFLEEIHNRVTQLNVTKVVK